MNNFYKCADGVATAAAANHGVAINWDEDI